jgi:hypothetical protein
MATQVEGQHCPRCSSAHPGCYLDRWCNTCQCFMCEECWDECNAKGRLHGRPGMRARRSTLKTEHSA